MSEENTTCQNCGASMKVWKHTLSRGLVESLMMFMSAVKKYNRNSIHLQNDLNFTKNQYNNFQKLHYFGLVVKDKNNTGHWLITRNGGAFLRNELEMQKSALSFRDKLVEREGEFVKISDYFGNAYTEDYWQKTFSYNIAQTNLF